MRSERPGFISTDYFLENPPQKPKTEVADYVESCGTLVPQRFANLEAALASGKDFIIRAEHPQDYAGASGIMESIIIDKENITRADGSLKGKDYEWIHNPGRRERQILIDLTISGIYKLPQKVVETNIIRYSDFGIGEYCRLLRLPREDFEKQISFSYWEVINARNQVIVADSAIEDRFHIFTSESVHPYRKYNYSIIEHGKVVASGPHNEYTDAELDLENGVKFYEGVRCLPRFNSSNVPIMETVFDGDNRYFLQYHRGRDFTPATFILDRNLEEDEIEADFVRGVTGPEGIICEAGTWYEDEALAGGLPEEEASFDFHFNYIFSEIMAPRRKLQFLVADNFSHLALETIDMHMQRSKLFKPRISIFINEHQMERIFPEMNINNPKETLQSFGVQGLQEVKVKMFVVSDGHRAYC